MNTGDMNKHHHSHHSGRRHHAWWQKYRFELTVLVLLALGVFLLVEKLEIKAFVFRQLKRLILGIATNISSLTNRLFSLLMEVETSDIVGILLILTALGMVFYRIRNRYILRHGPLRSCLKCGSDMQRTHRRLRHRILGLILWADVRYYSCKKCTFKGIRIAPRT